MRTWKSVRAAHIFTSSHLITNAISQHYTPTTHTHLHLFLSVSLSLSLTCLSLCSLLLLLLFLSLSLSFLFKYHLVEAKGKSTATENFTAIYLTHLSVGKLFHSKANHDINLNMSYPVLKSLHAQVTLCESVPVYWLVCVNCCFGVYCSVWRWVKVVFKCVYVSVKSLRCKSRAYVLLCKQFNKCFLFFCSLLTRLLFSVMKEVKKWSIANLNLKTWNSGGPGASQHARICRQISYTVLGLSALCAALSASDLQ